MSTQPLIPAEISVHPPAQGNISYAIVRSGTSRIVVLREEELPEKHSVRERLILDLLTNQLAEPGADRNHYQNNKAAVLGPGDDSNEFTFHFYQSVPGSRHLYSRMECSNAASAAAAAASAFGIVQTEPGIRFRTVNLATRQHVELQAPATHWQAGDWGVKFTHLQHLWSNFRMHSRRFCVEHLGMMVTGDIVHHGNVFVLTSIPPALVDSVLVEKLKGLGDVYAEQNGHSKSPSKVLIYQICSLAGRQMECEVACYSEGQQHRSFPGSAAMAMNAYFSASGLFQLPDEPTAETHLRLHHPSGTMSAHSHLQKQRHWEIVSTSFETPVRLIQHGVVEFP